MRVAARATGWWGNDNDDAGSTRDREAADTSRGRSALPGGPEDGHQVGEGGKADVDPDARRPSPLPRVRGARSARWGQLTARHGGSEHRNGGGAPIGAPPPLRSVRVVDVLTLSVDGPTVRT